MVKIIDTTNNSIFNPASNSVKVKAKAVLFTAATWPISASVFGIGITLIYF